MVMQEEVMQEDLSPEDTLTLQLYTEQCPLKETQNLDEINSWTLGKREKTHIETGEAETATHSQGGTHNWASPWETNGLDLAPQLWKTAPESQDPKTSLCESQWDLHPWASQGKANWESSGFVFPVWVHFQFEK